MLVYYYRYIYIIKVIALIIGSVMIFWYFRILFHVNHTQTQQRFFVIDISNSMNVQDIDTTNETISRLDRIKYYLTNQIANNSHIAQGIILFSQQAKIFVPPTHNQQYLLNRINLIHTNILPHIHNDNSKLTKILSQVTNNNDEIIFFTDSTMHISSVLKTFTGNFQPKLHIIGIGSSKGGFIRTANNKPIQTTSTLQQQSLISLANKYHINTPCFVQYINDCQNIKIGNEQHAQSLSWPVLLSFLILMGV